MALDLDLSFPLRGLDGRRDLVRAVVGGHSSDESDWLEWKTDPDLNSKSGCFHLAKAILGMANRPVEVAVRSCGGYGYVVVGAEPKNLSGVTMPDPAKWIELVEVYLKGGVGPPWDWTILPLEGKDVLVLTVEPPKAGDPPWPLRKELSSYRSGTLFVRKPGKTEPALAEDVDALCDRLRAGGSQLPQLTVEFIGDVPVPWLVGQDASEAVAEWVQHQRDRLIESAQTVDYERNRPVWEVGTADRMETTSAGGAQSWARQARQQMAADVQKTLQSGALAQFQDEPDERTLAEFTAEVNAWAADSAKPALNNLPLRYCDAGYGLVRLRVVNNSPQYLSGVEVRLHIAFEEAQGLESVPDGDRMPKKPWPFGQAKPNQFRLAISAPRMPNFEVHGQGLLRDTKIEDGSIKAILDAGDLRPMAAYEGDDFYIFLRNRPPGGLLHATWTATVQNRDGIIKGELSVPVREDPIGIEEVLAD